MSILFALLALAVFQAATAVYVLVQALVAWLLNMHVEMVQVGYGMTLWQKRIGHCVYRWALWPMGGFTKFRGDDSDPHAEPMPAWRLRYQEVSPMGRITVLLVGPLSNILLGIAALLLPLYVAESHLAVGRQDGKVFSPSAIPQLAEVAGRPIAQSQLQLVRDSGCEFCGKPAPSNRLRVGAEFLLSFTPRGLSRLVRSRVGYL